MARELNPDITFYNLPEASLDDPQRYASSLVVGKLLEQGRGLAQQGDVAGAIAKFEEALALDPDLSIDPQREAAKVTASALVEQGSRLAWQGDVVGAVAKFAEALALDEILIKAPPGYVGLACALAQLPGSSVITGTFCNQVAVQVKPIDIGESVTGTVASGAIDIWRFDTSAAVTVTIDLMANNSGWGAYLYLYAADGLVAKNDDFSGKDSHIEAALPPGGYLIGASGYSGNSNAYRLTLVQEDVGP